MVLTDREVLVALYNATGGARWHRKENWNTDAALSQWQGVKVNRQGRVVEVSLPTNNLTGEIPKALADLVSLEGLDLHQNKFYGTIPAELGQLPRLKRLRLSNNDLSGKIPEEVKSMATLEQFDCSDNKLSGLLPAWACMGTVHAEDSDPHPNQMYLFIMDSAPKSLRASSAGTRDEEARVRAVTWIQWHLDQDDLPALEEEPQPQPRPRKRQLGDSQVLLVELPQHHRARVRFEVKANSGTSRFVVVGSAGEIPRTVFGTVTDDAASTSFDDFPHKVVVINGTSPETFETSSLPSGQDSNERQGRGGTATIGARVRSAIARAVGLEMQDYHQLDVRHDGRVEPDGDGSAVDSPAPVLIPPPYTSFSLKRDDNFVYSWEEFVRRNGRYNNSFCSFMHNYGVVPLLGLTGLVAFLSPLWALLFFSPLGYLLYSLGVVVCALPLLRWCVALLKSLKASLLSGPGDVCPAALAVLALFIPWAAASYGIVWFVQNVVFGVIMLGDYALMYIAVFVVTRLFACCGVGPASSRQDHKLPVLTLTVEAADVAPPPNWV
ncbi:unnamed protein product [Ectocarpus sp. 12 AP-2014]